MALTPTEVIREALGLFRGAQGQSAHDAQTDARLAINAQDWSSQDKQAVEDLLGQLMAAKDELAQQRVLENYRTRTG